MITHLVVLRAIESSQLGMSHTHLHKMISITAGFLAPVSNRVHAYWHHILYINSTFIYRYKQLLFVKLCLSLCEKIIIVKINCECHWWEAIPKHTWFVHGLHLHSFFSCRTYSSAVPLLLHCCSNANILEKYRVECAQVINACMTNSMFLFISTA